MHVARRTSFTSESRFKVLGAAATLVFLVSTSALAADPESQPYDPSYEGNIVNYSYDSDWVPAMSPLQIRLQAAFLDEVYADMNGEATYDWDDETLTFSGTPNAGSFRYDIGVELTTSVQLNLGATQIPADVVGPIDIKLPTTTLYDPYLLPGNPDRPVDGSTSLTVNALDSDLNFGNAATGNVTIDIQVDFIGLNFRADQIDLSETEAGPVVDSVTMEDEVLDYTLAAPTAPETADVYAAMTGELNAMTSIHFLPSVTVTPTGGAPITIGPFDLDVNFPVVNQEPIVFAPELIAFEGPTPEPPGTSETSETSGETTDGGESESTGDDSGTESETETSGDPGVDGGDGCSCSSEGERAPVGALALFGLLALRRRRPH